MELNYIKTPFIPQKQVKLMLVDGRTPEKILNKLASLNIEVILTESCKGLNPSISYHPDIQLHPLGNEKIVVSPNSYPDIKKKLSKYGFNLIQGASLLKSNYPEDIAYNIARIGNYCFHKLKHTDTVIKKHLEAEGVLFINVNQGYSKCSTAVVNKTAIITSDKSIHKAAIKNGIDTLLIEPGYIKLEGQNYGFIGGCTGLIAPNVLAVTGSLKYHPDYERILQFLSKYKVEPVWLSDEIPIDLGSLIPLLEI